MKYLCLIFLLSCYLPVFSADFSRQTFWLLDVNDNVEVWSKRAAELQKNGINCIIVGGGYHHYLFNSSDAELDQYLQAAQTVVRLCHERGIKVIEHHSNVLISPEKVTESDNLLLQKGFVADGSEDVWDLYKTRSFCPNNLEYREKYWQRLQKILDSVDFDGIMSDDACFYGGCSCVECEKRWKQEHDNTLMQAYKEAQTPGTPGWQIWHAARKVWMLDFRTWLDNKIHDKYPDLEHIILANDSISPWPSQISGLYPELYALTGTSIMWEIYNPADFYSFRRLTASASVYRAYCEAPQLRAQNFILLPYADHADKRDVFDPQEEFFMWALARTVKGEFNLARVYLTGIESGDPIREFFTFDRDFMPPAAEMGLTDANVGIFFSAPSRDLDPQWEANHTASFSAWAQLLANHGIPYKAITDLTLDQLDSVKLVIVPDVFAISPTTADRLLNSGTPLLISGRWQVMNEKGEYYPDAEPLTKDSTLTAITKARPEQTEAANGKTIWRLGSLPANIAQTAMNEGDKFTAPQNTVLAEQLANFVARQVKPQVRINCNGMVPLFGVYRAGKTLYIPVTNSAGADLNPGDPIPAPSKVIWGEPKMLDIVFTEPVRSAAVLDFNTKVWKPLTVKDNRLGLYSPRRFMLIKVELD